jgi:hypothetical protein
LSALSNKQHQSPGFEEISAGGVKLSAMTSTTKRILMAVFQAGAVMLAAMVGALSVCPLAQITAAQDPIRVEATQVLVPVFVTDTERDRILLKESNALDRAIREGNVRLQEEIAESTIIRDLAS